MVELVEVVSELAVPKPSYAEEVADELIVLLSPEEVLLSRLAVRLL